MSGRPRHARATSVAGPATRAQRHDGPDRDAPTDPERAPDPPPTRPTNTTRPDVISGEELAAYAAGDADPALVARIESALPGDPTLAERLAAIRDVDAQLAVWHGPELDVATADRLLAAVDADLARLAADASEGLVASAAVTGDGDSASAAGNRSGGVEAAGGRPVMVSGWTRFKARWADLVDGVGVIQLAGAAAALVVVVGLGAVVAGGMGASNDSAGTAEMVDDLAAAEPAPEVAGDAGGGFASSRTESRTESGAGSEAMSESMEAASEMADSAGNGPLESEYTSGDGASLPMIDDGRVVADLDDIDPAALRERLEPLVDLTDRTEAGGDPAPDDAPTLQASRGLSDDSEAVEACRLNGTESAIVAEVVVLAPERDVILYVLPDRVVVVAVEGCRRLAVREG